MQLPKDERYTYADYVKWDGPERVELIDGVAHMMAPAPLLGHQSISVSIAAQLYVYLRGKPCRVYDAPVDVRLNADAGDDTVVQPDIIVVCDPSKIQDGKSCRGAPDMVVEILSPSSVNHDQVVKLNLYRQAGVREYWMVNPEARNVQVLTLWDGSYIIQVYDETAGSIPVGVLEGCQVDLAEVFADVDV